MSTALKQAVADYPNSLTEADERLVRVLLANPTESAFLSAAELSRRAGVHQASAVRLAQKLGYTGYPELRTALRAELVSASEPAERVRKRLSQMENDILGPLVASEAEALLDLPRHVPQSRLEDAARLLIEGGRVLLFGRGHATALVDLMDRRLRRFGFDTRRLVYEGRDLAEHLLTMRPSDVVLAFAFHRTPPGLLPLLEHADQVGASTLVVSDLLGPLLRPQPTLLLSAPRGEEAEYQTLSVPMTLLNALVLTIARLDDNRSLQALDRLADLIERFSDDHGNWSDPEGGKP